MSKEGENRLQKTVKNKGQLIDLADQGATTSSRFVGSEAALMFGVPRDVLKDTAITLTPRDEQVRITIGPDARQHLDNIARWMQEDRREGQKLLKEGVELLFSAGQASVNPSVRFKGLVEAKGPQIRLLEGVIPEIKELREHLKQGGRVQDFIREDRAYWSSLVRTYYGRLDDQKKEDLKRKGMEPENMFQTSDE